MSDVEEPRPQTPGWVDTMPQDAAVDPTVEAYVKPEGPVGEADPHGPLIVHPGLPGVDPKPGTVFPESTDTETPEPSTEQVPKADTKPATPATPPAKRAPAKRQPRRR